MILQVLGDSQIDVNTELIKTVCHHSVSRLDTRIPLISLFSRGTDLVAFKRWNFCFPLTIPLFQICWPIWNLLSIHLKSCISGPVSDSGRYTWLCWLNPNDLPPQRRAPIFCPKQWCFILNYLQWYNKILCCILTLAPS